MNRRSTLRGRIVLSHLAVVLAVITTGALTSRLLTPTLFEARLRAGAGGSRGWAGGWTPGTGPGQSQVSGEVQEAYDQALTIALALAAVVGILLAIIAAVWLTRRTLRSLSDMRRATSRLAAGDYQHPISVPAEAELADLATSINTLGADLAKTQRTRARLVSDLAHELRNPLATIEGYMEGLIDGVLPANTDTFSTVASEAHRLQKLTDDLALLSKAQEGSLDLSPQPIDLADVARAVVDRLEPQFMAKEVALLPELGVQLPVTADRDRLNQALTNLIGNALTHTPPGGTVRVTGRLAPAGCTIEVSDTGEGIPPDQLDVIFQRFTRLSADRKGTGIGLNIARTIVRLHGGNLTAQSEGQGKGATFTLTLPAEPRTSTEG